MGLLDALLKAYREEVQPGSNKAGFLEQLVEDVEKKGLKPLKNSQYTEFKLKYYVERLEAEATEPPDPIFSISKKVHKSKRLGLNRQNVEDVACGRENESVNLSSSIDVRVPPAPPVGSLARASNILNKLPGCDSCPACGYWDGYGRMCPGRYCFFSAVFKGKAARPVPIAEAQKACAKQDDPDLYED